MSRRGLAASKRMRLSRPGEVRALLRILDESGYEPVVSGEGKSKIERILMDTIEVIESPVKIGDAPAVYFDYALYEALRLAALSRMEQALVEANAAYNEGTSTHEQILSILSALGEAQRYADVVYTLTAMPEIEEDETTA